PMYRDFRDKNSVFTGVAGHGGVEVNLSFKDESQFTSGEFVTGNYFEVLGVGAALGRVIVPEDDTLHGGNPVVVLSHFCWTNKMGANSSVLNQTLLVNGKRLTIIGVAKRGFFGVQVGYRPDVFVPISLKPQLVTFWKLLDVRNDHWIHVFAR